MPITEPCDCGDVVNEKSGAYVNHTAGGHADCTAEAPCRACGRTILMSAEGDFCDTCESEFAGRPRGIAQYLAGLLDGAQLDGANFGTGGTIEADEPLPLSGTTQYEGCLVAFQVESNDGRRFRVMVEEITLDIDRQ